MKYFKAELIGAFMFTQSANASDDAFRLAVIGAGVKSCGAYVSARAEGEARAYEHYWMGFVSAYNLQTPKTYDILGGVDVDGSLLWIENYCREKPLESFFDAIQALLPVLKPNRIKSSPKS